MLEVTDRFKRNALICLPQDLHTLYVYWDFTPQRLKTLGDFFNNLKQDIKLNLQICNHNNSMPEQEITFGTLKPGGHYFHNLSTNTVYRVEFGVKLEDGKFILFYCTPAFKMLPHVPVSSSTGICTLQFFRPEIPEADIPNVTPLPSSTFQWS